MKKLDLAGLRRVGISMLGNPYIPFVIIFLLGLSARLGYVAFFVGFDSPPTYDGTWYDTFANDLLRGEGYHSDWGPSARKPPLYPVYVAGLYALLGTGNYGAIRASQAVIGALSGWVVYLFTKRMFGPTTGFLAGLGVAVYPLFLYMSGIVYPETLYLFLLSAILFFTFRVSTPTPTVIRSRSIVLAGLLLGITALCRSNLLSLFPVLFVWPFLNVDFRTALRVVVLMFFVTGLVILPWTIRNYVIFDEFVLLSTQGGGALWQGNNDYSAGGGTWANEDTWPNDDYPDRGWYGWSGLTEPESSRKFAAEAKRWIRENPRTFIALIPRKILRAWSPVSFTTQSDRTAHPLTKYILIPYIPFLLLVAYGVFASLRSWRVVFPLYALPAITTLQSAVYFGGTRYSISMAPALIIFAAAGIGNLARHCLRFSGGSGGREE